jgi:hypothetical protein
LTSKILIDRGGLLKHFHSAFVSGKKRVLHGVVAGVVKVVVVTTMVLNVVDGVVIHGYASNLSKKK